MRIEKVQKVKAEALELLNRIFELEDEYADTLAMYEEKEKDRPMDAKYYWNVKPSEDFYSTGVITASIRRQSMELTRALANMRKSR